MRHIIPFLHLALVCAAGAAETTSLVSIDFTDGKLGTVTDNTYKGDKPTLSVIDAADPKRGKELSIQVAAGGFAQLMLGKLSLESGALYTGTAIISASADAKVQYYLRMAGTPYTRFLGTEATIGSKPSVVTFSGVAKDTYADVRLMIYTEAPVTLRIDDISLVHTAP